MKKSSKNNKGATICLKSLSFFFEKMSFQTDILDLLPY